MNELIWQRTINVGSSKSRANKFSSDSDTILFYAKTKDKYFKRLYRDYSKDYIEKMFRYEDEEGRYRWQCMSTYSKEKYELL